MWLHNVHIAGLRGSSRIRILDNKIKSVLPDNKTKQTNDNSPGIYFENAIAFPGFINSHDHLDFNVYPSLRSRLYVNYEEWGRDIHVQFADIIQQVLKIPLAFRIQWGVYKNLLNGVTTVVNHGALLQIPDKLITIYQECAVLHSVQFEKNWKWKLNRPFIGKTPFVIHTGEGTDEEAAREIDQLVRWNVFNRNIIGIHGVAMNEKQAPHFKALVWCPASNYFLLNNTAPVDSLRLKIPVIFGTDSTLTASWNLWDHFQLARKTGMVNDEDLLSMVTSIPAQVWGFRESGRIADNYLADITIVQKRNSPNSPESLFDAGQPDILLVMHHGKIILFDSNLLNQLTRAGIETGGFSRIYYDNRCKYVKEDLPALVQKIRQYYPGAEFPFTCAGDATIIPADK